MSVKHPLSSAPVVRSSLQTRIVSQTVILTAFVIVVLTTLSFWIARVIVQQSSEMQLLSLSFIAEGNVEQTLRGYRERASFAAAGEELRSMVRRGAGETIVFFDAMKKEESSLKGAALFARGGRLLAATGETDGLLWEGTLRTYAVPRVTDRGWESYDVIVPVRGEQDVMGALALRFDTTQALSPILTAVPLLGRTARLIFLFEEEGTTRFVHPSLQTRESFSLSLPYTGRMDMLRTLTSAEGVGRMENERGRDTLVAYRFLPTIGWGMLVEVERADVLHVIGRLALAHAATGTMLLVMAAALALALARQVTEPLRLLTAHVRQLGPGRWLIKRTVRTEDEVGILERVFMDLSTRLRRLYDHQEEEIKVRTDALKKQYALDRAILMHITYGIVTVDPEGHVSGANPAAASLLGMSEDAMQGVRITDVLQIIEKDGKRIRGGHPVLVTLKKRMLVRSSVEIPRSIRRKDGSKLPVTYVASPLLQGRRLFGAIMVFQDVTEERRLEERKSEFVALASHQLRTPLSSIHWYAELLSDRTQSLTTQQRAYLAEMKRAGDRMLALLTTLLHAAQYEGKGVRPSLQEVDLSALVMDTREENKSFARESHVTCGFSGSKQPVIVRSDPVLLKIVLQNLLINAIKYSMFAAEKKVSLSVKQLRGKAMVQVKDTGIGIVKNDQKRIFERFFRGANARKLDTDGNGLGLSICKSIVDRLGGTITFTSKENKGATFTVMLPDKGKISSGKKKTGEGKK